MTKQNEPDKDPPSEVRKRVKKLQKDIDTAYIQLGRDYYLIYHRKLFEKWGHDTFNDYIETEVGTSKFKAERCRRIWTKFVKELRVKPIELEGIGYSFAYQLLSVVNVENVDEWLKAAKSSTWRDLAVKIAAAKAPAADAIGRIRDSEPGEHDGDGDGDVDHDASEIGAPPSGASFDSTYEKRSFNLYPSQAQVVEAALDEIKRSKPTEVPDNEALAHICQEFIGSRMTKEERPIVRVNFLLSVMEKVYGGRFVWLKNSDATAVLVEAMEANPHLFADTEDEEDDKE